jgi:hypothetical protein
MATPWHLEQDLSPGPQHAELMARVLEGRHGCFAADVALFFSVMHNLRGDAGRSWAWVGVADEINARSRARLADD